MNILRKRLGKMINCTQEVLTRGVAAHNVLAICILNFLGQLKIIQRENIVYLK